jgi:hypothetical protein
MFVLYIEFADDPPRVAVFDNFEEAEGAFDAFEVTMFDPPLNDGLDRSLLRARIFDCRAPDGWGVEVDIYEARKELYARIGKIFSQVSK